MTRRNLALVSVIMLLILAVSLSVTVVFARGIFDGECPDCSGTGKIRETVECPNCNNTGKTTISCPDCNGTGQIICPYCDGTGDIKEALTCFTCYGTGKVNMLYLKDTLGDIDTLPWGFGIAHIQGVFHNAYDKGVEANVTARVETIRLEAEYRFEENLTVYFPPHEDVTVKIDVGTAAQPIIFDPNLGWTYSLFISSSDNNIHEVQIPCPDCSGTGLRNTSVNDPVCGGTGLVDDPTCKGTGKITISCPDCNGTGKIDSTLTCSNCVGIGYLRDWTKFGAVSTAGVGAVLSVSILAMKRGKKTTLK